MSLMHYVKREMKFLLPAIIYFFICFNLLYLAEVLLFFPEPVRYAHYISAVVGTAVAGKVIFIVEKIPRIDALGRKPLVYNIVWKFFIYAFFVVLFQLVEHFLHHYGASRSLTSSYKFTFLSLTDVRFWGIQILVLMLFLAFIVFHELFKIIGHNKIKKIFFKDRLK